MNPYNDLWVEKYRPNSLKDYVFKNKDVKDQIEYMIRNPENKRIPIPHLLFSGSAGTGKCIDGSENITIITEGFKSVITFKTLFTIFNADDLEYEKVLDINEGLLDVETPTGTAPVIGLVKKYHEVVEHAFDNGLKFSCSPKHLVHENGVVKKISECETVDTINGSIKVIDRISLGMRDVYDIALNAPHLYVTPNGIIHHNTSLVKIILKDLGVEEGDRLELNASRENNVDTIRNKIVNFASTWPLGEFKVVFLDEADQLSPQAQKILRGEMERFSDSCRFVLTANYPQKILPALHSRLQVFTFDALDEEPYMLRIIDILEKENVQFEEQDLANFVETTYPDMRKCINLLNQYTRNGVLHRMDRDQKNVGMDWLAKAAEVFKSGRYLEARKLICSQINGDEYEDVYKEFWSNLEWWSNDVDLQSEAILIINEHVYIHSLTCDPEVNLAACLIKLSRLGK